MTLRSGGLVGMGRRGSVHPVLPRPRYFPGSIDSSRGFAISVVFAEAVERWRVSSCVREGRGVLPRVVRYLGATEYPYHPSCDTIVSPLSRP